MVLYLDKELSLTHLWWMWWTNVVLFEIPV